MDIIGTVKKTGKRAGQILTGEQPASDETDILDTLKDEHDEVKVLLETLVESQSAKERKSLVARSNRRLSRTFALRRR